MQYANFIFGKFIERPNRFVAVVEFEGRSEVVHVKNTGRCKELLLPGSKIVLTETDNEKRKTRYDLIAVWKKGLGWVNIDSQAPNQVVREWLESGKSKFKKITYLKPEYTYDKSRIDFYLEQGKKKVLIEVKGCTLEEKCVGYFPDAPTERGVKHLRELAGAVAKGYECYLAFVIAMPKVTKVLPNVVTHPEFGVALAEAQKAGVKVLYLPCEVKPGEIRVEGLGLRDEGKLGMCGLSCLPLAGEGARRADEVETLMQCILRKKAMWWGEQLG